MSSNDLVPEGLDPVLEGVRKTFHLEEEFKVFLDRNEDVRGSRPDVGFLLFLIEQQREAIIDLEMRLSALETGIKPMRQSYAELIAPKCSCNEFDGSDHCPLHELKKQLPQE